MKVERNTSIPQQLNLNNNKSNDSAEFEASVGTGVGFTREKATPAVEDINSVVDNFTSENGIQSKIYNRFRKTNSINESSEFVRATVLKPGTYKSIDVSVYYDGLTKNDFRDVDVWKNTIGKTVYGISKTLQFVHDNSQTAFPTEIQFSEKYTVNGFKSDEEFMDNLKNMANQLSEGKINLDKMQEEILPMLERYL